MANNFGYTEGSGKTFSSEEVAAIQYPKTKIVDGSAGGTTGAVVDSSGRVATVLRKDLAKVLVTPVVSTAPAYTAGDAVGGILQFAGLVRASGGAAAIRSAVIHNKANSTIVNAQIVLFDRTFTHPGDNAAWNPSDADMLNCLGTLHFTRDGRLAAAVWTNNISTQLPDPQAGSPILEFPFILNGTDLFCALVTNATPTFTSTSDIQVGLTVERY